jgi:hypothetical protein
MFCSLFLLGSVKLFSSPVSFGLKSAFNPKSFLQFNPIRLSSIQSTNPIQLTQPKILLTLVRRMESTATAAVVEEQLVIIPINISFSHHNGFFGNTNESFNLRAYFQNISIFTRLSRPLFFILHFKEGTVLSFFLPLKCHILFLGCTSHGRT